MEEQVKTASQGQQDKNHSKLANSLSLPPSSLSKRLKVEQQIISVKYSTKTYNFLTPIIYGLSLLPLSAADYLQQYSNQIFGWAVFVFNVDISLLVI